MLTFKKFITEGGYNMPVVSIDKTKVGVSGLSTRNEINRNLAAVLSSNFVNPYDGWVRIRKVLDQYGVVLPKVVFQDQEQGEEVVALSQFGDKWGATLDGVVTSPNDSEEEDYFLYYNFGIDETGFYDTYAKIVTEDELNDILEDDSEDEDIIGPEGELDPRQ
jgi:hypothetical protein